MVTNRTVAPLGLAVGHGQDVVAGRRRHRRFFEKTFAPLGLRKIQGEVLANLTKQVEVR